MPRVFGAPADGAIDGRAPDIADESVVVGGIRAHLRLELPEGDRISRIGNIVEKSHGSQSPTTNIRSKNGERRYPRGFLPRGHNFGHERRPAVSAASRLPAE